MIGNSVPADAVVRAAWVARSLRGQPIIVKLGGSAMENLDTTRRTLQCVAAIQTLGVRVVLVHGGGKPIDRAMAAAGLTPVKVQGRRYTDEATLAVVVRVLAELNADVVRVLEVAGGSGVGFTQCESFPLAGERLMLPGLDLQPVDLGRVGTVTSVNVAALGVGGVPVLPSLARAEDGGWLNVNADTVASAVAGAMHAAACYFLTDTPGVLRDVREPASLIPRLTVSECRELIASGVIAGGMIPKVEACFEALAAGAGKAVILDGRDPRALLGEFVSDRDSGTAILP